MQVIDLTHTIYENMPVYPGTDRPKLEIANTYEKNGFRETLLTMFSHTGTHMDAPAHLFAETDIVIIENLTCLGQVGDELFTFCALPIKYNNSDGAPVRAVAILHD